MSATPDVVALERPNDLRFRRTAVVGSAGASMLALAGLLAYLPGLGALGSFRPDFIPMAPSTAGCVLILSLAVYSARGGDGRNARVHTMAALVLVVTVFALLTFAGSIVGVDLTPEAGLTRGLGTLGQIPVGRMSPATGAAFAMAGLGTFLLLFRSWRAGHARRLGHWASSVGVLTVLIGATVLLAYLFGAPLMYQGTAVPMAATTAVAVICLGTALSAAAGPASMPIRLVVGDSTSARLSRAFVPLTVAVVSLDRVLDGLGVDQWLGDDALMVALSVMLVTVLTVAVVARVTASIGTALDDEIAGHALAEERRRLSELQMEAAFSASPIGLALVALDGRFLKINRAFCEMLGYSDIELLDTGFQAITHPDDLAQDVSLVQAVITGTRHAYELEKRYLHKDGRVVLAQLNVSLVRDAAGAPLHFVSQVQDITARKRAALERKVLHEIAVGVSTSANLDTLLALMHRSLQKVLSANNCFVALHDARTGLFSFPYFADERDSAPLPVAMSRSCSAYVFRSGIPVLITPTVMRRLKEQHEVELVGSPSPSWMGVPLCTPLGPIGVLVLQHYERENVYSQRDLAFLETVGNQMALVIERQLADTALREREAELRLILESTADGMLAVDGTGKVLRTNRRFAEMWRVPPSVLDSGDDAALLQHVVSQVQDPEAFVAKVHAVYASTEKTRDTVVFTDGRVFERYSAPILTNGAVGGRVWSFHDITARQRADEESATLQETLRQAQKMESVGRLAGGVAHDFNNMLGVILGNAELALQQVDAVHPVHGDLLEIQKAAKRSADLTRQLLAYARKQSIAPELLDLNDIVPSMLSMLRRLLGADIRISWRPAATLWPVSMDPSQLANILTNVCLNARDAIADVGTIVLTTANRVVDLAYCSSQPDAVPGDFVRLSVCDSGGGMDEATRAHIFEPFFTTKGVGEGTGLGLASVYGAVRQNHGFVTVFSVLGEGTTLEIYLPRQDSEAKKPRKSGVVSGAVSRVTPGGETILLVEDEAPVLTLTTRVLASQGYVVLAAASPAEALRVAREHTDEIHLLLTDVVMPDMNGRELAKALSAIRPHSKQLFMSGHTADVIERRGMLDPGVAFIEKPYALAALINRVRETLDEGVRFTPPGD